MIVGHDLDGHPVTVSQRIIELLQAGNYVETAAEASGVSKVTVYSWMRRGAHIETARIAAETNGTPPPTLTPYDQQCVSFLNAVVTTRADSIAEDVDLTAKLARGGLETVTETRTTTVAGGKISETTVTRTETLPPDARVLLWRLERRVPQQWGRKDRIEIAGDAENPVTVKVTDGLVQEMVELAARIAVEDLTEPVPIEASVVETRSDT